MTGTRESESRPVSPASPARRPRDGELEALLDQAAGPEDPARDREWAEALAGWVLVPDVLGRSRRSRRLALLVDALASDPRAPALRARIRRIAVHDSAVRLLAETGLPSRTSFGGEIVRRVVDRLIPRLDAKQDLYALIERFSLTDSDVAWLAGLPDPVVQPWEPLLRPPPEAVRVAALLVAQRAAAVGLSRDVLALQALESELDSPFFELPRFVEAALYEPASVDAQSRWDRAVSRCYAQLRAVDAALETSGVSTDLVFRLELLGAMLERIDMLIRFAGGRLPGHSILVELARGAARQRSIRELTRSALSRLSRKLVEHSGYAGEHYLAADRREWWAMGRAGAGGGVITGFTAVLKFSIAALPLAPMMQGIGLALNYAASFIAIQLFGFTLSSKQPASTGAALAHALEAGDRHDEQIELIASISRGQVAATLGNIFFAVPAAMALDAVWRLLTGNSFLTWREASYTFDSLHPLHPSTLFFAAVTGVYLWIASMASGGAANWSAYRRLPEAVRESPRLRRVLGGSGAARLGDWIDRYLSGSLGYVALGFMLGFLPVLFRFMGLGIDIRHVTLSAAQWALAVASDGATGAIRWNLAIWSAVGVLLIGVLNFTVSFALALWVAVRARGLAGRSWRDLVRAAWHAFYLRPARFILPPGA
jgi:site-specific recombinase